YQPLYEGKKIFTTIDRPTSYEVMYTLKVTIYALENLGKILANISEINETTVYGLSYTSTKIEEIKREVLKEAASDAREKAVKLAEGSGAILGKVIKIESVSYERPLQKMAFAEAMPMMAASRAEAPAPQVESGYIEVTGGCTVSYAIQ
ncbi:MAG: SIMPL domain-containing protein, partial [Candidatus Omnitrophica bacterium]|nr:SIMPL domain-containing protein [Candidatus Omnitrophota bacterium]